MTAKPSESEVHKVGTHDRTNKRAGIIGIVGAGILSVGMIGGVVANASTTSTGGGQAGIVSGDQTAATNDEKRGPDLKALLAGLVGKGTLTQAQADAVQAALEAARPSGPRHEGRGPGGPGHSGVATYLGLTETQLREQVQAGKSLAQIAVGITGKTREGLIAAIVKAENDRIDQGVASGRLTADQATKAKAEVAARATAQVDRVGTPGQGGGRPGGQGPSRGPGATS